MKGRRRVLLASQPLDYGVPRHVLDVIEGLDLDRFELDVACPRESVLWDRLRNRADVRVHPIGRARRPAPGDAASLRRLFPLVRRADVVHGHSSKAGFLVRLAAAGAGRRSRCVFTPHGWSFWATSGAEARMYRALERRAARWCSTIVAVSEHERSAGLAARVGRPEQYRLIPNGIELERFSGQPRPVDGRVVMLGRLAPPKRPDLVVRALARVRARHENAELQLVGDGPARAQVESLAKALGLSGVVRVTGRSDDIPEILAGAQCLVLASDYEAMPLSVLEAMAAAVPVVATRLESLSEVVVDGATGLLVEPDNPDALAAAIERLLDDPTKAAELGAAGRRRAQERFSKQRMVAEISGLYEEILQAR
jgi:glycosyltransferase involved in cell wall biosynthesis